MYLQHVHFGQQGVTMVAYSFGSFCLIPATPLEHLYNIVPLKFGFGLTQVSACGKEVMGQLPLHRFEVERHVVNVEDTVTAEDYQAFDHVLQLANIPWPMI